MKLDEMKEFYVWTLKELKRLLDTKNNYKNYSFEKATKLQEILMTFVMFYLGGQRREIIQHFTSEVIFLIVFCVSF
jgi:hypothetical protein